MVLLTTACSRPVDSPPKSQPTSRNLSSPPQIPSSLVAVDSSTPEVLSKINVSEPVEQTQVKCDAWTIIPRICVGSITVTSSELDLISMFGKENIKRIKFLREGYPGPGVDLSMEEPETETVLFPNEPEKKLIVSWSDLEHQQIATIEIRGEKSLWHTSQGITLGTTLKQLEEINGTPFSLYGFGWDGSGFIVSWNGGKLSTEFGGFGPSISRVISLSLRDPDPDKITPEDHQEINGDKKFISEHPILQRENPPVLAINIRWAD